MDAWNQVYVLFSCRLQLLVYRHAVRVDGVECCPADIFKGWLMVLNVLSSPLKHPCCLGPLLSTGLDPPKEG
eukprot:scaffold35810_cov22-Tisochrysis_lutea.AAC.1